MVAFLALCIFIALAINIEGTVDYLVSTKTGAGPGCGTDALFNVTFVSTKNDKVTFQLDGDGDKLESRNRDQFAFSGKLVYPLDRILLQRVEARGWSVDWYIHWLTVEVNNSLYAFRINRWIRNDKVFQYIGTLGSCAKGYERVQECRQVS